MPQIIRCILSIYLLALLCNKISTLKHHLVLTNDDRSFVSVSSFGYLQAGRLEVLVSNLTLIPDPSEEDTEPQFGFILSKLDVMRKTMHMINLDDRPDSCVLNEPGTSWNDYPIVTMAINPKKDNVILKCSGDKLPTIKSLPHDSRRDGNSSHESYIHKTNKRAASSHELTRSEFYAQRPVLRKRTMSSCSNSDKSLPLMKTELEGIGKYSYSFNFTMSIANTDEEGFYYLTFHNCRGFSEMADLYRRTYTLTRFNLSMYIYETNYPEIYLSAGSMALPQMYFMLSVMYFLAGCVWVNFISRQRENTLKIHRLMSVLVFAKTASLLFHGINYHYIAIDGQPVVTWAYLYYATRTVKGALFFLTLVLIGTGWSFVKHILSDKDKKIIIVVCCLQAIAHIAEIVLDESTEGEASNEFWAELCSIVDLFSCIVILVPISWSVKHLEDASRTDGKAAINLKKLELFKRFYIISTIYIYITRIITFLFFSALSYKYSWLAELVSELVTLVYFIVTGCYFQPMPTNPYLLLSNAENDTDEDILFSVDAHDLNGGSRMNEVSVNIDQDRNTLLDEGKQKVTRRLIEDTV